MKQRTILPIGSTKTKMMNNSSFFVKRGKSLRRLLGVLLLSGPVLPAQTTTEAPSRTVPHDPGFASIHLLARASSDSIILRWAPGTPHAWRLCNRIGYTVKRRSASGGTVTLTQEPLLPWDPDQLKDALDAAPQNRYIGVAALALWSDTTLIGISDSLGLDTLEANAERNTLLYGYALFSADNDPSVAGMTALRFVDRSVRAGETYTYIVSMSEARDYRIIPGEVTVVAGPDATVLPPPKDLTAEGSDGRIDLVWSAPEYPYTGYEVLRSDDGGRTYRALTVTPIVILRNESGNPTPGSFRDTAVVNYRVYGYRVRGIDAFGMTGPHAEASASARDLTPPFTPFVRNPEQLGSDRIKLSWEVPEAVPDLAGFHISRSALSDSGFRRITDKPLPKSARSFTDDKPDEAEPFYIVSAIDTAGNIANSLPLFGFVLDTLPPAVPTGLTGVIDSSGIVTLRWNANRERNLLGYRVLWSNALDHEFSQRTGQVWKDTVFTDTVEVNTLTKHVYYQVAALNWNYNHSLPSEPLEIRRPDVVPPEAPVFTDVLASDSSVLLRWVPSGSGDLREHVLLRRVSGEDKWMPLATLARGSDMYEDRSARTSVMYEYQIEAVDSSGLRAMADVPVQGRPYDTGLRPAPAGLRAVYDERSGAVTIEWRYSPRPDEAVYYVIYRSFEDAPMIALVSAELPENRYTDKMLVGDGDYSYAVRVMTRGGAESPMSGRVSVKVGGSR